VDKLRALRHWRWLRSDESGEGALEYVLIAAALAIAGLATVFALAGGLGQAESRTAESGSPSSVQVSHSAEP